MVGTDRGCKYTTWQYHNSNYILEENCISLCVKTNLKFFSHWKFDSLSTAHLKGLAILWGWHPSVTTYHHLTPWIKHLEPRKKRINMRLFFKRTVKNCKYIQIWTVTLWLGSEERFWKYVNLLRNVNWLYFPKFVYTTHWEKHLRKKLNKALNRFFIHNLYQQIQKCLLYPNVQENTIGTFNNSTTTRTDFGKLTM